MASDPAVVAKICSLPVSFRADGRSPLQLVAESGYLELAESVTVARVTQFLNENPTLVDSWLSWSEDKKVSSGWYFIDTSEGFVVGYHPNGQRLVFSDKTHACAEFIVREVESIREAAR